MRVTHVITGLSEGGAENMLLKLVQCSQDRGIQHSVISLIDEGTQGPRLTACGAPVVSLGLCRGMVSYRGVQRLVAAMEATRPDLIQTWMYHGDLLGGIASRMLQFACPVVWNIRHSNLKHGIDHWKTFAVARSCALLSRWIPSRIIVNSQSGLDYHSRLGYRTSKLVLIPNGFDAGRFRPNPDLRTGIRRELGITDDIPLIGNIGRFHPQKDHATFISAMDVVLGELTDAHVVMCGDGVEHSNTALRLLVQQTRNPHRFHLLGLRTDIHAICASLDVSVQSSAAGEGFSNVIGESMACGIPCVATDVGDARSIVGHTGFVVPPGDSQQLSEACLSMLSMPASEKRRLSQLARDRVSSRFSLSSVLAKYVNVWEDVSGHISSPQQRAA